MRKNFDFRSDPSRCFLVFIVWSKRKTTSSSGSSNSSSTEVNDGPSAYQWRGGVKGTWILNTITRENIPSAYTIKTVFEEAPAECFEGSVWDFPSNGKGSIEFTAEGTLCAKGAVRNIVWSIYNPGKRGGEPQFQFKKIFSGDKARNVKTGYRMDLSFSDGEKLVMKMPVDLGQWYRLFSLYFSKAVSEAIKKSELQARKIIADLRKELEANVLTTEQLNQARKIVASLKVDVSGLKTDIVDLKAKNEMLKKENEILT
ncbi:hypothetical protein FQR65_LT17657 [Abscondita terminalis]|nr:hypothetical protein FQR65_LT17657 [Abscondita terminalis]